MDTVFRSISSESTPTIQSTESEYIPNDSGGVESADDIRPLDDYQKGESVLEALDIDDSISNMPENDKNNIGEVENYIKDIIKNKGLTPTAKTFKRVLNDVKGEMGIDKDTEPSIVLERISGVIRGYKSLSFIKDPSERKRMFMKMSKMETVKEMDSYIMEQMERGQVWQ